MKTKRLLAVITVLACLTVVDSGFARAETAFGIEGLTTKFNVEAIENNEYGFDYKVAYEKAVTSSNPTKQMLFDTFFNINSKGYIVTGDDTSKQGITSGLTFNLNIINQGNPETRAHQIKSNNENDRIDKRMEELDLQYQKLENVVPRNVNSCDPQSLTGLSKEVCEKFHNIVKEREFWNPMNEPKFIKLGLNIAHESNQELDEHNYVAGLKVTTDFGLLGNVNDITLTDIIDYPFSLLRSDRNMVPDHPIVQFNAAYVTAADNEKRKALTEDDDYLRVGAEIDWETYLFNDTVFNFYYQTYYEIDAPETIKEADKELSHFLEISLGIPVNEVALLKGIAGKNDKKTVFIKYIDGEYHQTNKDAETVMVGFSVDF